MVLVLNYKPSYSFNWDGIRTNIKDSILISEYTGITSGHGGMGVSTQNEVDRRKWVMKNATTSELLKLVNYPNGNIKAIAYEGLLRKKDFLQKTKLILRAIQDTAYFVNYQSGCIVDDKKIGEYLVNDVLFINDKIPPPPPEFITDFGLKNADKEKILKEFRKLKLDK